MVSVPGETCSSRYVILMGEGGAVHETWAGRGPAGRADSVVPVGKE